MLLLFLIIFNFNLVSAQDLTNIPWHTVEAKVNELSNITGNIDKLNLAKEIWGTDFLDVFLLELDCEGNSHFAFACYKGDTVIMQKIVDLMFKSVLIESTEIEEYLNLAQETNQSFLYEQIQGVVSRSQALKVLHIVVQPNNLGITPLMEAVFSGRVDAVTYIFNLTKNLIRTSGHELSGDIYKKYLIKETYTGSNILSFAVCRNSNLDIINAILKETKEFLDKDAYRHLLDTAVHCSQNSRVKAILEAEIKDLL